MIPVTDDVIEFEHSDWLAEIWFKYQEISESHQMPFLSLRSRDLGVRVIITIVFQLDLYTIFCYSLPCSTLLWPIS